MATTADGTRRWRQRQPPRPAKFLGQPQPGAEKSTGGVVLVGVVLVGVVLVGVVLVGVVPEIVVPEIVVPEILALAASRAGRILLERDSLERVNVRLQVSFHRLRKTELLPGSPPQ